MRFFGRATGLMAASSVVLSLSGAQAAPPAEAFGNLPLISMMRLSPDGHHIAAIQNIDGKPEVMIYAFTPTGVTSHEFGVADGLVNDIAWAGNDHLIVICHANLKGPWDRDIEALQRAVSISADAQNPVLLMGNYGVGAYNANTGGIVDIPTDDPSHVYIQALEASGGETTGTHLSTFRTQLNVYRVDVATGSSSLSETGSDQTGGWFMDGHGHAIAKIDVDENLKATLFTGSGADWKPVYSYDLSKGGEARLEELTEDGNGIVIMRKNAAGLTVPYRFEFAGAKLADEPLFQSSTYDIDGTIVDEWTRRVIGVSWSDTKPEQHYFDADWAALQKKLEDALPGQSVVIESADLAKDAFVIESSGPRQPPIFQLYTPANGQLSFLAAAYPLLTTSDLGEMRPYPYRASDGLAIDAYLTLPPGKDPHDLPTVIFPHGGPEFRDDIGFDWWAQFMASRGYAVLQPNFRGSSGYGAKFRDAGNGQWGAKMQDDVTDGVKQLIADRIADPKRICIVGASYGGYAALAGATFTPDLYACVVAFAGVSDLPDMLDHEAYESGTGSVAVSYWQSRIGDRDTDEKSLEAASPARHADRVMAPVLLIHSDKDVTVPINQSVVENRALQAAGKNVQFITLEGDDHYLELASTRTQLLKAVETFLSAHIGN